jgi:hypothetical protein
MDPNFDIIAFIGHNPDSGKSCWYNVRIDPATTDGSRVPPPNTSTSDRIWMDMGGIRDQGCPRCHDSDPWVHSPWVDGALDGSGHAIVPRIGEDSAYSVGTKYSIFARESFLASDAQSQSDWKQPQFLANIGSCGSCHRIGANSTTTMWAPRSVGDSSQQSFQTTFLTQAFMQPARLQWMPPSPPSRADQASLQMIASCAFNPAGCSVQDVPQ